MLSRSPTCSSLVSVADFQWRSISKAFGITFNVTCLTFENALLIALRFTLGASFDTQHTHLQIKVDMTILSVNVLLHNWVSCVSMHKSISNQPVACLLSNSVWMLFSFWLATSCQTQILSKWLPLVSISDALHYCNWFTHIQRASPLDPLALLLSRPFSHT